MNWHDDSFLATGEQEAVQQALPLDAPPLTPGVPLLPARMVNE